MSIIRADECTCGITEDGEHLRTDCPHYGGLILPMPDETQVEVIQARGYVPVIPADREVWIKYENFDGAFADRIRTGSGDNTRGLQIIARYRAAFAAPPAGERGISARDLFEIMRPCFYYAKRGTPDGGSFEQSETGRLLMNGCKKLAALSHPLPADREAIARVIAVADAWDAHCLANARTNAAIPAIDGTRAERAVYDERYRASEEAKREMYRAAQEFAKWASANRASLALPPTPSARRDDSETLKDPL